ncbi:MULTISPECIES: hypothetical protein [unclassified Pseudoalteromonas]
MNSLLVGLLDTIEFSGMKKAAAQGTTALTTRIHTLNTMAALSKKL